MKITLTKISYREFIDTLWEYEKEQKQKEYDFARYINDPRWETYDPRYHHKPSWPYS